MCAAVHFQKMLCADFSCARKDSLGQFHKLHEKTYSFRLDFSLIKLQDFNIKINFTSGQFWHFFPLTKEEDDAFRLIFRFWATLLLLLRGLSWHKGHFVGISLFFINF